MVKTNVMRLLDAAHIAYETGTYEVDENDLSGSHAADLLGVEHDRMYKQNIHNALRYFAPNIFLNFIPDKKYIHPSKADAPTLQSKNLPNTSALYCGRKNLLIHSLSDKRT